MASGQERKSKPEKKTESKANTAYQTSIRKKSTSEKSIPMDSAIKDEIILISVFALMIFVFLCNLGIGGVVGNLVRTVMFGLFGMTAYLAPMLAFLGLAFRISNKGNRIAARKLVAAVVLFFLLGMVCDLLTGAWKEGAAYHIGEIFERCSKGYTGGGVLAGTLAYLGVHFLSMIGTILLIIVLTIICLVIVTEKSFVNGVKNGSQRVYERTREDVAIHRERSQKKKAEQLRMRRERGAEGNKTLRMDKKASGVTMAPVLRNKNPEEKKWVKEKEVEEIKKIDMDKEPDLHKADEIDKAEETDLTAEDSGGSDVQNVFAVNDMSDNMHEITMDEEEELEEQLSEWEQIQDILEETSVPWTEKEKEIDNLLEIKRGEEDTAQQEKSSEREEAELSGAEAFLMEDFLMENALIEDTLIEDSLTEEKPAPEEGKTENLSAEEALAHEDTSMKKEGEEKTEEDTPKKYQFPPLSLLKRGDTQGQGDTAKQLQEMALHLQNTLATFGVKVNITDISQGPSVTRFELQPEQGVKVSKIVALTDDIKLNLAAADIRIEAPIPGKAAVGIEVPNQKNAIVALRDLIESREFQEFPSKLAFAVGKDIGGKAVVADIAKMPHMLIAGATGSGKSVCINTLIMSILYHAEPSEVKLIMVDPKVVELSIYNGIPHLLIPVVTDPKKAAAALHWGVSEMEERYRLFAEYSVRNLEGFNHVIKAKEAAGEQNLPPVMPQIVIIVDELADLMMVAPGEVEGSICRLAQLARAAGIHLIIATQRPSVDVITGLIKANMPSRVAFAVSSGVDSRTILDMNGAEKLLGKGDMLFYPQSYTKPARVQGALVYDEEVEAVVDFLKNQAIGNVYSQDIQEKIQNIHPAGGSSTGGTDEGRDQYFEQAGRFIIDKDKASIGMLQRVFKIGFNRAARIMDQLSEAGVVGEEEGTKPRKVLMGIEQFEQLLEEE